MTPVMDQVEDAVKAVAKRYTLQMQSLTNKVLIPYYEVKEEAFWQNSVWEIIWKPTGLCIWFAKGRLVKDAIRPANQ